MTAKAYAIGTLRQRPCGIVLESVSIKSEPAWGLSQIGEPRVYVELLAPTEAATFAEAARAMAPVLERYCKWLKIPHLLRLRP